MILDESPEIPSPRGRGRSLTSTGKEAGRGRRSSRAARLGGAPRPRGRGQLKQALVPGRAIQGRNKQQRKWSRAMVHFKNRYLVMEVFIDANRGEADPVILTQFNITKAIRDSIQLNFGECGLAASLGSLQVKYVNPLTKLCVIRVSREDHQKVWAAITMVMSIGKIPVSFNLLDVSGTIRACTKAALECEEAKYEQYKLAAGDRITPEIIEAMKSCFDKLRGLDG